MSTTLYEQIQEEKKQVDEQLSQIQKKLKKYPVSNITCFKDRKWVKWYINDGKERKLLHKREKKLAQILAMKKYLKMEQGELLQKKKAIDLYLKHYNPEMEHAMHLLDDNSAYKELLSPFMKSPLEELQEWGNKAYQSNPKYPDQKIHMTISGYNVRSKAEAMIEKALADHHIPHRYECALEIDNDVAIYPDFTILHPRTRKKYIWEHFGMMGEEKYVEGMARKLVLYSSLGILPGVDLIMTCESQDHPLTIDAIEKVTEAYFEY